jgi:hypothetical protein
MESGMCFIIFVFFFYGRHAIYGGYTFVAFVGVAEVFRE